MPCDCPTIRTGEFAGQKMHKWTCTGNPPIDAEFLRDLLQDITFLREFSTARKVEDDEIIDAKLDGMRARVKAKLETL